MAVLHSYAIHRSNDWIDLVRAGLFSVSTGWNAL